MKRSDVKLAAALLEKYDGLTLMKKATEGYQKDWPPIVLNLRLTCGNQTDISEEISADVATVVSALNGARRALRERLQSLGVDMGGPMATDFDRLSPEEKKAWVQQVWHENRDMAFWATAPKDKAPPPDIVMIERPGPRKHRYLANIAPVVWAIKPKNAMKMRRPVAEEILQRRDIDGVIVSAEPEETA